MITISVLIINHNTAELVKKCVESVLSQRNVEFEVIVIDNRSRDDSVAVLQQFIPRITLISNSDNKGFGKANNQAFKLSRGRYIFMLNPDAVCLSDLDLYHAVQFMDEHTQYGLIGTRILNGKHHAEKTAYHYYPRQKQTSANFSHLPGNLATVLGASMVARRDVFEKVNGFDEDFFLYGEETDLCLRIRKAGFMIGYCDSITVQHVGNASGKDYPREEMMRKKKSGKLLFYCKHYPEADVRKIVKNDLFKARFNLIRLSLIKMIFGLNAKQEGKYRQQFVARDLAKHFLNGTL